MPRYFFEVSSEKTFYEDAEGEEYPNDDGARKAGERLAIDLSEDEPHFNGSALIVMDEEGNKIGEFAIRPAERRLQ